MKGDNHVVLVTRPQKQATEFIDLLKSKGFNALSFPCLEIQPVALNKQLEELIKCLNEIDLIIFISANAVVYAAELMHQQGIEPASLTSKIATIGKATLSTANALGFKVNLSPDNGFNSESLLALKELQAGYIKGTHCLIFRGVGGLENLADALQERGVRVRYAEVYQRSLPEKDAGISRQQLSNNWGKLKIGAITVTSNESLQNLYDMLEQPGRAAMLDTLLIVASQRCLKLAQSLGFKSIRLATSAINQHMLEAVEQELN